MSKTSCILCVACISLSWWVGCSRKDKAVDNITVKGHNAQQAIRSTADLHQLLIPGLETDKIREVLGEPHWKEDSGNGQQMWHFSLPPFPADGAMQGSSIIGVMVGITNGRLANWGGAYTGSANDGVSRRQTVLAGNKGQADSPTLQFFLVSTDPIGDGRFIDTERLPKLGFVARSPTLSIRRLKEVTLDERVLSQERSRTNWSFGIFLTQEDGAKLKAITATNISKKLLIVIGAEPVSAPTIMAPLVTGSLEIDCDDRSLMESVKQQLAELERQGQ